MEESVCRTQASHFNQTQERENKSEGASSPIGHAKHKKSQEDKILTPKS